MKRWLNEKWEDAVKIFGKLGYKRREIEDNLKTTEVCKDNKCIKKGICSLYLALATKEPKFIHEKKERQ